MTQPAPVGADGYSLDLEGLRDPAVEMEAAELYMLAARYQRRALAVLTISDHILRDEALPASDRETSFGAMVEIALEAAFA